ncbi:hypothetical protein B0H14DRAFT_2995944, partial [Mycena olivaceomarginata]
MNEDPPNEPQVTRECVDDGHGSPLTQYTSASFSHSKYFTVTGGSFTNINYPPPNDPPNFRRIPMGDLYLRHEIRQNTGSTVARRRMGQNSVRRMYSVRVHGSSAAMTAVLYQGEDAEKQWRAEISQYSELRHPNLLQLYGIASMGRLHAAVFHEDFVAYLEFWKQYDDSHFSKVFFWACIDAQLQEACRYISSVGEREPYCTDYTVWIRPSAGVLSIELTASA